MLKSELTLHWLVFICMLLMVLSYVAVCLYLGAELQLQYAEEQRIFIRSIFYIIAIVTMPLINLIRHIMLRLNQTMPGKTPAKLRYLITLIISLSLVETIGLFGLIMFVLGDDSNTLYIFTLISILGLYINRPQQSEYHAIVAALEDKDNPDYV